MIQLHRFVGSSRISTSVYSPFIQSFLTSFLTTDDDLALSIKGDSDSTAFGSLSGALEGLSLGASIKGMNANPILTHVNVYISASVIPVYQFLMMSDLSAQLSTLVTNLVEVDFDVHNPLDADLQITRVQADSGVNNEVYALYVLSHWTSVFAFVSHRKLSMPSFNQAFESFVVPAGGTANSGRFDNVLLTKGALASLPIIPLGYLDVACAQTVKYVFRFSSTRDYDPDAKNSVAEGGYEIPWLQLWQPDTPTTSVSYACSSTVR